MHLSYVILTHNRREALLRTLRVLIDHTPLNDDQWEAIVVENGSTDGTADAVRCAFPCVRVIQLRHNEGSPARNTGVRHARGEFVMFLDDDSYPCGDTVEQSLQYMRKHTRVGVVGGCVLLPDGSQDAAALPMVMPACALCVRRTAFEAIGGFASDFFRQAEEYDLIFRMLDAGWDVRRLETLIFRHEKVRASRNPALIQQLDLQNNLLLAARFFPRDVRRAYRHDWLHRYAALARYHGHEQAISQALSRARVACVQEAHRGRHVLDAALIEVLLQHRHQLHAIRQWSQAMQIKRVVIAQFTKNLYATWRACSLAGLDVVGITDDHPAYAGMAYRNVPIIDATAAAAMQPDGVILSNTNPAQITQFAAQLRHRFSLPVLQLWQPTESTLGPPHQQDQWWRHQQPRLAV